MSLPNVVVTGAAGYVGPHVVTALLDAGHTVTAVVRPGSTTALDPRAEVREIDILAPDVDLSALDDADALIHLAWKDGFAHNSPAHLSQLSAHYDFLTGMAARGTSRIVALGTMHEIGYWEGAIDESTPTNPLSQYGIAKDALRRALPLALPAETTLAWVRAYYIYGDDLRNRSIFAHLLRAVDEGRTEFPFTSGKNKYDFIRVEELGRQIAAVCDSDEIGVINCSSGTPISLADQVEQFIAENQLPIRLEYGAFPDRPYDSPAVWGDATRITRILQKSE